MKQRLFFILVFFFLCALLTQDASAFWPFSSKKKSAKKAAVAEAQQNVRIKIIGAKTFTNKTLLAAISDTVTEIQTTNGSSASADDGAFFIGLYYRKHGYSQAKVTWKVAKDEVILTIVEGPLTTISKIAISGNAHIPEDTLKGFLTQATQERFSRAKPGALPFVEADINSGAGSIASYYKSRGFLDSMIDAPKIKFSRDKTKASIHLTVHEGTQYHFGKLAFTGDLVFYHDPDLQKKMDAILKEPYTPQRALSLQRDVLYFYQTHGYFKAKVVANSDPLNAKRGVVPVQISIQSGDVYHFGNVTVSGLQKLHPSFIHNRFRGLKDEVYNPETLAKTYRKMIGTGLFKTLRVKSEATANDEVQLQLTADEAKSRELGFSGGYGTYEGLIAGIQVADRDLLGYGRPVSANLQISQRGLLGAVEFLDPWFLESKYTFRARLYALTHDYDGYSKTETGLRLELSRQITKHLKLSAFYLGRVESITNTGIDPDVVGATSYFASSLGLSTTLDYRDSILNPTKGWVASASADYNSPLLGSAVNYFRAAVRLSYFIPIKKTLLAFGARGGLILPMGSDDSVPIDERFFNGGGSSVRSFAERQLGPRESHNYPIGGNTFTVFNAEYIFPLYGALKGAVFVDAGNVGPRVGDGFGEMRYGVGTGLRYALPVGMLRLDYGYNPDRQPGEATGAIHFSFGFAF